MRAPRTSSGSAGEKVLLVDGLENLNLHLASRNRPGVKMLDATSLNAYEVLNHRWIVASEPARAGRWRRCCHEGHARSSCVR